MTTDQELGIIRSGFLEMTKLEIVIAPWLAMSDRTERRLNSVQHERIHALAHELALMYNAGNVLWWNPNELPESYRKNVYYETLLSTAASLSYMRLGTLIITDEMIAVAHRLIQTFAARDGGAVLMSVYVRVMFYLSGQLLKYYSEVPNEIYASGKWHRPWTERSLEYELEYGITAGLFSRHVENEQVFVKLTKQGEELYSACKSDLDACGYLKQREQLMRAANFTNMNDYEPMMERMNPKIHQQRKSLVKWSSIDAGMQVLELGCGAGALTLDDGLCNAVGSTGRIVATDPSIGMLARAEHKKQTYSALNVDFRQAAAENIPFPDETFDAVIGMLFLHFTDIPKSFHEISRVTKPGGTFTTLYGLNFSRRQDFFMEWFEPLFRNGLVSQNTSILPNEDIVPAIAENFFESVSCVSEELEFDFSDVETVVHFLVQGGTMAELNELPWRARIKLFEELIERGHRIKQKYGAENMKLKDKVQWFRAIIKK